MEGKDFSPKMFAVSGTLPHTHTHTRAAWVHIRGAQYKFCVFMRQMNYRKTKCDAKNKSIVALRWLSQTGNKKPERIAAIEKMGIRVGARYRTRVFCIFTFGENTRFRGRYWNCNLFTKEFRMHTKKKQIFIPKLCTNASYHIYHQVFPRNT